MPFFPSVICKALICFTTPLLFLLTLTEATTNSGQIYLPQDVTSITLYGAGAEYNPSKCPKEISFMARASALPGLQPGRLGLLPADIMANGAVCSADVSMIDVFPIGDASELTSLPPQWIFEDSTLKDKPINFTCGDLSFSVMYGYFNDVKTNNGYLDPNIVYFDFAVYPYTKPFSFCSYANRMKKDEWKPLHRAPFPLENVWNQTRKIIIQQSIEVPDDPVQSPVEDEDDEDNSNSDDMSSRFSISQASKSTLFNHFFSSFN